MKASTLRDKLCDEINKIPDEKVSEILTFIQYYRLGLGLKSPNPKKSLQFAGSWKDMPDHDFNEFLNEIAIRRDNAFKMRKNRETGNN